MVGFTGLLQAQVGIGNAVPDSGAILDLNNGDNKGLALPVISAPPHDTIGLIFFDESDSIIKYFNGLNYNGLSPWKFKYGTPPVTSNNTYYYETGNVGIGTTGPQVKLSIDGGTEATTAGNNGFVLIGNPGGVQLVLDDDEIMAKSDPTTMDTLKLQEGGGTVQVGESQAVQSMLNVYGKVQESGFALVPQGVIVMWHGLIATVPEGWALCDGNFYNPSDFTDGGSSATNSGPYTLQTPDLRDRFIVATGGSYTLGNTGGEDLHALTVGEMPSHTHDSGSLATSIDGAHSHNWSLTSGAGAGSADRLAAVDGSNGTHTVTTTTNGAHSHTISGSTGSSGSGTAHENRPPYYALAFIMKL